MSRSLRKKAMVGSVASVTALLVQQGVAFFTQIAFASLLSPEEFGEFAFSLSLVLILGSLSNFQGENYLLSTKKKLEMKFNVVLTFELIITVVFFIIFILLLPEILAKLGKEEYSNYSTFLLPLLFYNPLIKYKAILDKKMKFTKSRLISTISHFVASLAGLFLAYLDFGVYSLFAWRISQSFVEVLLLFITVRHRVRFTLDREILVDYLRFSLPVFAATFFVTFYYQIDYYIVEYLLGKEQLGYYFFAFQISAFLLKFRTSLNSVFLPMYSNLETDALRRSWYLTISKITGLLYVIPSIIIILFGGQIMGWFLPKWTEAIVPLKILTLLSVIRAIIGNSTSYLYSKGISKNDLLISIINAILIPLLAILGTLIGGLIGTSFGVLLAGFLASYIATDYLNKKYTSFSFVELTSSSLIIVIPLLIFIFAELYLPINVYVRILFALGAFTALYFLYDIKKIRAMYIYNS